MVAGHTGVVPGGAGCRSYCRTLAAVVVVVVVVVVAGGESSC